VSEPISRCLYENETDCSFSDYIAHLDGVTEIDGGWINHNYIQLGYQLADSVSGFAYSFFGTCIILFVMNLIPGLSLRAPEEDEIMGIDDAEIGEFAVSSSPFNCNLTLLTSFIV
jgi:ammonia channel protein AmtB